MKLKSMIAAAAALFAVAAIPVASAQAGSAAAGIATMKGAPAVSGGIVKVHHRKFKRHFRYFHWRHVDHGCGFYWHMWRKTGYFHWKRKFKRCKFYYY